MMPGWLNHILLAGESHNASLDPRGCNQNRNEVSPHTCQNGCPHKAKEATSVGEDVKEREPSCTVGGNGNWCSQYGLTKLKIELPYDPAIPLLGIYPKELKSGF